MCGIAGSVLPRADRRPDEAVLRRMAECLRHRGPDDEGFHVDASIGLAIRRLNVIDLETGHQPMTGEDGRVHVVFNGEIYNFRELRAELEALGHTFRTRSDTEAIVHGWEAWGTALFSRLDGMFGLAVWDAGTRSLTLARDRIGIKPLYYAPLPRGLVFASELRALLEHPDVPRELDVESVSHYLAHEYVPAPRAILRGVRKLPAGHWLTYTDGHVKVEPYWDLVFRPDPRIDEAEAIERLREAIGAAVRAQLVADVPLGVFLSGGIDSGTVAAFAAREVPRVQTFSIGFEDRSFDESAHARRLAAALGTEHHEEIVGTGAALDLVERLPDLVDEPLADASILPTFLLSRFARRRVTVALSGDGGDELFAGYPTYQAHRAARLYLRVPRVVRDRLVAPAVRALPVSHDNLSLDFRLKRFVDGLRADDVERHVAWMGAFSPADQRALLADAAVARLERAPSWDALPELAAPVAAATPLQRLLYLDLKGYLGEGVLTKVDRASMACSLEVRVPLLDRRVVDLAAILPDRMKLKGFRTKHVLKQAAVGLLPRDIAERPKKGFGVPVARWFRSELAPLLDEALSASAVAKAGLFQPAAVRQLVDEHRHGKHDHRKKLYTLLVLALWTRRHRVV
ncbi:MAG: asparagine synthase (glutamine-hydrolyzing) [Candidatus Rokubacteria bacterium]|nr:asparagine synthase (glutamine-hydrolyzing) [Candidatus Rokubacteria bacterium]